MGNTPLLEDDEKKVDLIHKCSVCKKNFKWASDSKWFGGKNSKKDVKICSLQCQNNSKYKD